jgi:hypothetical protein
MPSLTKTLQIARTSLKLTLKEMGNNTRTTKIEIASKVQK